MERLSSGKRINSAKDDAAGSAVAAKMRADITSINQAVRNTNDGISLLNTYDGAAAEVENMLTRMRELAVQAKTGTYQASDMDLAAKEYDQLKLEIRRIAQVTAFNRVSIANGSATTAGAASAVDVEFKLFVGARVQDGGNSIAFSAGTLDLNNLTKGDTGSFTPLTVNITNSDGVGGLGTIASTSTAHGGNASGVFGGSDHTTTDNASAAIVQIDRALDLLASKRANAGALINRLEHTVANLLNVSQRLQEAESRITDADYAAESANLARGMVLAQAGTAMLAQANQQPQYILQLLR